MNILRLLLRRICGNDPGYRIQELPRDSATDSRLVLRNSVTNHHSFLPINVLERLFFRFVRLPSGRIPGHILPLWRFFEFCFNFVSFSNCSNSQLGGGCWIFTVRYIYIHGSLLYPRLSMRVTNKCTRQIYVSNVEITNGVRTFIKPKDPG